MRILAIVGAALALATIAAPADARRTAIDSLGFDENGFDIQLRFELGGYCDLNGDDCGAGDGQALGYTAKIGTGPAIDRVYVHGNGILSFGSAIDFNADQGVDKPLISDLIFFGQDPALVDYRRNLVSAGQNNPLDFETFLAFFQSAKLKVGPSGTITAEWFKCLTPTSQTFCPSLDRQFLHLVPGRNGFRAILRGSQIGVDPGFVIDGVTTTAAYGTRFLIPAEITGLDFAASVPEPASWAMLIAGFGLTGGAMRRRRAPLRRAAAMD